MSYFWVRRIAIVAGITILATAIGDWWGLQSARRPAVRPSSLMAFDALQDMPSISMNVAGVSDPQLVSAEDSLLDDSEVVIGIVANGEPRAYLRRAFDNTPTQHVVNDRVGSIPVTITHCDHTRCTRVLTNGKLGVALRIGCGGWLAHQGMALRVNDQVYAQLSPDIPLQDLPFEVTTWKEWHLSHPNTLVYTGSQIAM